MSKETVLVVLGIRLNKNNPMPATITQWPKQRRNPSYQHLSPDQLEAMDGDQTALWTAEFVEGHYWLETRIANGEAPPDPLRRSKGFEVPEEEIPF
jgi:hypothetical protein